MEISNKKGKLEEQKCDLLVVNAFAKTAIKGGGTGDVDRSLDGLISEVSKEWSSFDGAEGQSVLVRTNGAPAKQVLLVGLGDKKAFSLEVVRNASALAHKVAKTVGATDVVSILHGAGTGKLPAADCATAQVEGVRLGSYKFDKLKKEPEKKLPEVKTWTIVTSSAPHMRAAQKGAAAGELFAEGTVFARDLVNTPAQEMTPKHLVAIAETISKDSKGKIKIKVLNKAEIKKAKMGGLYGVGQGSDNAPYFVHMHYKPSKAKKRISLVGKAVTFDSGGLSLKPSQYMETMKMDMAGSAAVLGAFSVLARLAPKVEIDGIFGAAENMPSGNAIRPGDVLRAKNGKTMEVLNTDAEGRLTLADSLSYASELKPDFIIDLATLTGACVAALGEEITGLMGNNAKFSNKVLKAASSAGEKMWELPLEKKYKKLIESKIADVKNIGGRYGGAITAGLFLQEFVDEKIAWVHLDIAGPAYAEKPMNAYTEYGGTGVGVPTLIQLLTSL